MSFVPLELIYRILESGYYTLSGTPDYQLLKACTLVCRTWSGPAQALLFRSPPHIAAHTISKFYAALLSSAVWGLDATNLGDCVRTLDISVGRPNWRCCPDDFVKLLQACPRVYELVVGFYEIEKLEEDTLKKLWVSGQRVKALDIVWCEPESLIIFQLLAIWLNIKFLTIRIIRLELPCQSLLWWDAAGEFVQRPASGARACLYALVLHIKLYPEVIAWLLASSASSLRILGLRGIWSWSKPVCPKKFALYAPHIRSLRLYDYDKDSAALVRMCTALEELVLRCVPETPLAPDLPPTIEHLSFGIDYKCVKTLLPKLKLLTCGKDAEYLLRATGYWMRGAERRVLKLDLRRICKYYVKRTQSW